MLLKLWTYPLEHSQKVRCINSTFVFPANVSISKLRICCFFSWLFCQELIQTYGGINRYLLTTQVSRIFLYRLIIFTKALLFTILSKNLNRNFTWQYCCFENLSIFSIKWWTKRTFWKLSTCMADGAMSSIILVKPLTPILLY